VKARRRIETRERRARLVARHHLGRTAPDVETGVRDLVAVHSSDPVTPYLALWARVPQFRIADLDRALYGDRTLWRMHAMRRTLFVVATDDAATVDTACAQDVARAERRKLEQWVGDALDHDDPRAWLHGVEERTLAALADGEPRRTQDLAAAVEGLSLPLTVGSGKWTTDVPLSSRLLFLLALEGHVVRAQPAGSWLASQYRWATTGTWFTTDAPRAPQPPDPGDTRARLARAWLRAHGPATTADLRWWTGWTARAADAALKAVGAVEVDLDGAGRGWVLPDDLDTPTDARGGVALLPGLDPTVMGWKQRDWYLGDHAPQLFDRNGNAGPTVWLDGRVVGGWAQRPDGEVVTRLLEDVGAAAAELVDAEAAALTAWLSGVTPTPRFRTPLERALSR
jgi:hypothetical protein